MDSPAASETAAAHSPEADTAAGTVAETHAADTAAANPCSESDSGTAVSSADTAAAATRDSDSAADTAASAVDTAVQAVPDTAAEFDTAVLTALHSPEAIPDASAASEPNTEGPAPAANAPASGLSMKKADTAQSPPSRLQPHGASHLFRLCTRPHSSSAPASFETLFLRSTTALSDRPSSDHR
jgi:hypothetical protein